MASSDTFKISNKEHPEGVEVTNRRKPDNLEEFEKLNLVKEYPAGVITLAYQMWKIKAQGVGRDELPDAAAVQKAVDEYTFGVSAPRASRAAAPKITKQKAAELRLTEVQLAALREMGYVVPEEQAA